MDAAELCDELERIYDGGEYPALTVRRPWSSYNPTLVGELARPAALRSYLMREMDRLAVAGAEIAVAPSRPRTALDDPSMFERSDESNWDLKRKKLFLFPPERMELSLNRLSHYTGTEAEAFQRYVLFTNYHMHVEAFVELFPDCIRPSRDGVQMPAYHHRLDGHNGITLVNIGVGPSNAKTITDHVAVLRPDLMMMIGHCGGLRNRQEIGDFVLATAYLRADQVLDDVLAPHVPIVSNFQLNQLLYTELERRKIPFRMGTVFTTANRNWEFNQRAPMAEISASRAIAVDMESATVATNGFRYRVPSSTLLVVSDKPLHGQPKLEGAAREFYEASKRQHVEVAIAAVDQVRVTFPAGLPSADLRSSDEPLIGGPSEVD
ncbi:MAG: AMP nucleosidase [Acidimicrobiales bacterium]